MIPDMNEVVGRDHILWITLDTLRFDVAQESFARGEIPHLAAHLPASGWERRHAPGSFTYASHHAFFSGFLPTPALPGKHPRLFAAAFQGSETTRAETCVFEAATVVEGLKMRGYHTACIGGVGFFNERTPLGSVLPSLFDESHWRPEFGVTCPESTAHQFRKAREILEQRPKQERCFLFINISAIHQPNRLYLEGATGDDLSTHAAALRYVDSQWPLLLSGLADKGPWFCMLCSDHGTAYGEQGFFGHRLGHSRVWEVPYTHFFLHTEG